jgi:predicted nucleic acid-binding protein
MADVLVDTSVWIDFFRHKSGRTGDLFDALLAENRVLLCGVVEMEIFQGLRGKELHEVRSVLQLIPYIDTTREDFIEAGGLWNRLRRKGITIPPTDCLIAQMCLKRDLSLFTIDAHFDEVEGLNKLNKS